MTFRPSRSAVAIIIAATTFTFSHARAVVAQQSPDTIRIRDIVVTATKLPMPASATGHAVTVITGDDLRARGVRRVVDALRTVPGVAVAQLGGTGAVASVFMRGGESDYVQVLVDGVQVNDPGGTYDWAHLTTDDIERIEVVRGPASVLYGSDAVAGVVQIFTRGGGNAALRSAAAGFSAGQPQARTFDARAQLLGGRGSRVGTDNTGAAAGGSYDAFDWNASLAGAFPLQSRTALSYAATASQLKSDGAYAFNNEYDNRTFSGRLAMASLERAEVAVTARHIDHTFHYPTTGSGAVIDRNKFTDGTSLALGATAAYFLTPQIEARAQLASYRSETGGENPADAAGDGFDRSTSDVRRRTGEVRLNAYLPRSTVTSLGVEMERQRGATTFDSDGAFGPYNSSSSAKRSNTAYYAQVVATPVRALDATAGVRMDDNDQFGRFTTGRLAAGVRVASAVRLRGAYGTGFKEPTFFESYATGFAVGDPDLQPEHSRSVEVGADVSAGGFDVGVSWFDQRFRDLIQYTFAAPAGEPNYFNIGRARAAGLEITGRTTVLQTIGLDGQYTFVDSNVTDDGFGEDRAFLSGGTLLRRPTHQASLTASARPVPAVTTTGTVVYTGKRDDLDFSDPAEWAGKRVSLPSHVTLDASASYRLPARFAGAELLLRASNLFDERYDEVSGFPGAGRVIWIGASVGH